MVQNDSEPLNLRKPTHLKHIHAKKVPIGGYLSKMKLLKEKLTIFVIRAALSVLILIDAVTDTLILRELTTRLLGESLEYVTKTVTLEIPLKSLKSEPRCSSENVAFEEVNKRLDQARVDRTVL